MLAPFLIHLLISVKPCDIYIDIYSGIFIGLQHTQFAGKLIEHTSVGNTAPLDEYSGDFLAKTCMYSKLALPLLGLSHALLIIIKFHLLPLMVPGLMNTFFAILMSDLYLLIGNAHFLIFRIVPGCQFY